MNWYVAALKKYADFTGRSRRKEYWMFTLVNSIIMFVLSFTASLVDSSGIIFIVLYAIYALAVFVPSLAVTVRRLHDTGRSGAWYFLVFVPVVGAIVILVFMCLDSDHGSNQYGPTPKHFENITVTT
ncbi:hypothetical protein CN378_11685 [Bacillus sp. AFS015802]|uniref:DUF805 domain-containing protein n=1 Tax=Bacillus sp. AFS015802 TaxID=2033486 RepID=UPI000BF9027D|nr:DUF805 domain-containing protein [Bacillus sp. AFS015802]PFA67039.1 hypothetical protein CN378_11685 [Bacillus sp. AFS015802]